MPELPEVETVARGLAQALTGARIERLAHLRAGIFHAGNEIPRAGWATALEGRTLQGFGRRGKWLVADLGGLWWAVHLRMTGRLLVTDRAAPRPAHTHLELATAGRAEQLLRFVDPRRFGRMLLTAHDPRAAGGVLGELGPEPLALAAGAFVAACRARPGTRLKALLLDQRFLAGLGNIYVDESLFVAGLPPGARAGAVPAARLGELHAAIGAVLEKAIRLGGTSMRDYIHPDGGYGAYHEHFLAYGRGGEACAVCGGALTLQRMGQRATVFCRSCQRVRGGRGLALAALAAR
ncbi:MAG: bifunctional DNA-formamidopyrimidine glycosylase/DNA-(apurinic or apyrimidinic site) lyase [Planctomycetota bacterium]